MNKETGPVGAVGVSCHDLGALKVAAAHPWVDVIFARINHRGGREYFCDALAEEVAAVLKAARRNGKAVVGTSPRPRPADAGGWGVEAPLEWAA